MTPEQYVIGACLLNGGAVKFAAKHVTPMDFYEPRLGEVFRLMVSMAGAGEPIEPGTVAVKAASAGLRGVGFADLFGFMENTRSDASVDFYAAKVRDESQRRQLRITAQALMRDAQEPETPPAAALSTAMASLKALRDDSPVAGLEARKLAAVLEERDDDDWLVRDLFKAGDRMILTGYEGLGKSTWIRQMAVMFAAGINPVTFDLLPEPIRVTVLDVENTEAQWRSEARAIVRVAVKQGRTDPAQVLDLACSGRIDLTRDRDLSAVHRLVDDTDPQILFIGPIYKMVPRGINNDDDAAPLITALDSLRDRGLVMVMEGHSPKGGNGDRDLSPRGSAALMGWPEFGHGMRAEGDRGAKLVRWRGDRDRRRRWPHKLWRGGTYPWVPEGAGAAMARGEVPTEELEF